MCVDVEGTAFSLYQPPPGPRGDGWPSTGPIRATWPTSPWRSRTRPPVRAFYEAVLGWRFRPGSRGGRLGTGGRGAHGRAARGPRADHGGPDVPGGRHPGQRGPGPGGRWYGHRSRGAALRGDLAVHRRPGDTVLPGSAASRTEPLPWRRWPPTRFRDSIRPLPVFRPFPRAFCGGRPPPPTRSRVGTSTTTGGGGSTPKGSGCADSSGDACDSFYRWDEDVDLVDGHGPGCLPVLARVEPDRTGRRGVLGGRPRSLPADLRPVPWSGGSARWSPSITSPRRCGWPTGAVGSRPTRPTGFARFVARATGPSGGRDRSGLHLERAQCDRGHGLHDGGVPARGEGRLRAAPGRERRHGQGPPAGGGGAAVGAGELPGRAHPVDGRIARRAGGRSGAGRGPGRARGHLPAGDRGRRLRGGAVLHADALRRPGPSPRRPVRRRRPRWATSTGPRWSSTPCGGRPPSPGCRCW